MVQMDKENEFSNETKSEQKPFKIEISDDSYLDDADTAKKEKFEISDDYLKDFSDDVLDTSSESGESAVVKKRVDFRLPVKIVVFVLILACAAALAHLIFSAVNDVLGMIPSNEIVVVDVPKGAKIDDIARLLNEKNVVKYPKLFNLYTGMKYKNVQFKEGQIAIDLSKHSGYDNLISEVRYYVNTEVVTVTLPEGFTVEQIAYRLEDKGVCSADSFMASVKMANFDEYDFVRAIKGNTDKYIPLEGYIFPSTYEFYVNSNAPDAVKRFLDAFEVYYTDEMKMRANELGLTVDEVVTLASLVQSESGDPEQMPIIASIFLNRLNDTGVSAGRLESDVTINYVEQFIKPYVSEDEAETYSLNYNTYKCKGIPAGAVSNPGLEAINAVLYPAETSYFFFVNDTYGNYYYAQTLEEHNVNVRIAFSAQEGD